MNTILLQKNKREADYPLSVILKIREKKKFVSFAPTLQAAMIIAMRLQRDKIAKRVVFE